MYCVQFFRVYASYKQHLKKKHGIRTAATRPVRSMTVCERCLEIFDNRHAFYTHARVSHGDVPREDVRSYDITMDQLREFGIMPRTLNWADEPETNSDDEVEIVDLKVEPEN